MDALNPDYQAAYKREFHEMQSELSRTPLNLADRNDIATMQTNAQSPNFPAVMADNRAADAAERAAKLTPHQMQTKLQALFDAADGDCIDVAEDALAAINIRCKEIERIEGEAEEAYEVQAMRGSSAPRKI